MVRTEERFPDLGTLKEAMVSLCDALDPFRGNGMLFDSRNAPGRFDPEFEKVLSQYHPRMVEGFSPFVILLKSAVGVMHASRLATAFGKTDFLALTSEDEADRKIREYLRRSRSSSPISGSFFRPVEPE